MKENNNERKVQNKIQGDNIQNKTWNSQTKDLKDNIRGKNCRNILSNTQSIPQLNQDYDN